MTNVISLASRQPIERIEEIELPPLATEEELAELEKDEDVKVQLDAVDDLRRLVAAGKMDGLIILGRTKDTGIHYSDVAMPKLDADTTGNRAFWWAGLLDVMKGEFLGTASMAPCIMPDGSVMSPWSRQKEIEDQEFGEMDEGDGA